jgi:hypothetical protein
MRLVLSTNLSPSFRGARRATAGEAGISLCHNLEIPGLRAEWARIPE